MSAHISPNMADRGRSSSSGVSNGATGAARSTNCFSPEPAPALGRQPLFQGRCLKVTVIEKVPSCPAFRVNDYTPDCHAAYPFRPNPFFQSQLFKNFSFPLTPTPSIAYPLSSLLPKPRPTRRHSILLLKGHSAFTRGRSNFYATQNQLAPNSQHPPLRPQSAKGAAARRQTATNSRGHSGGALDTVPVLRVSSKGDPGPKTGREKEL